ncbi:MAG: glycosyltransferase family 2 protein [Candidatus Omnitrophota bacterium]
MEKGLVVVISAYNEARFIKGVAENARGYAEEVVVVDDGSKDKTAELAKSAGATVISHSENSGKGTALRTGFEYAYQKGYPIIITMDGDGQHHPEDMPVLLEHYRKTGAGVVVGCRSRNLKNMPVERFVTNWFTSFLVSLLAGQRIRDSQSGFRVFDSRVIPFLSFSASHFATESEVLVEASRAGFKIAEAPIRTIYGQERSKQHPLRDTVRFFKFFFRSLFKRHPHPTLSP